MDLVDRVNDYCSGLVDRANEYCDGWYKKRGFITTAAEAHGLYRMISPIDGQDWSLYTAVPKLYDAACQVPLYGLELLAYIPKTAAYTVGKFGAALVRTVGSIFSSNIHPMWGDTAGKVWDQVQTLRILHNDQWGPFLDRYLTTPLLPDDATRWCSDNHIHPSLLLIGAASIGYGVYRKIKRRNEVMFSVTGTPRIATTKEVRYGGQRTA